MKSHSKTSDVEVAIKHLTPTSIVNTFVFQEVGEEICSIRLRCLVRFLTSDVEVQIKHLTTTSIVYKIVFSASGRGYLSHKIEVTGLFSCLSRFYTLFSESQLD